MPDKPQVQPGRVDHLAKGIFQRLVSRHPNPAVHAVCKIFGEEIDECMAENLGPGTKADQVGRKILRAFDDGGSK